MLDGSQIVDLGAPAQATTDDYCGNPRSDGQPDIGALEYEPGPVCDTTTGGGNAAPLFADGFEDP